MKPRNEAPSQNFDYGKLRHGVYHRVSGTITHTFSLTVTTKDKEYVDFYKREDENILSSLIEQLVHEGWEFLHKEDGKPDWAGDFDDYYYFKRNAQEIEAGDTVTFILAGGIPVTINQSINPSIPFPSRNHFGGVPVSVTSVGGKPVTYTRFGGESITIINPSGLPDDIKEAIGIRTSENQTKSTKK